MSFLTTAYRTEDTIGATIESVLAQTRTDWELVVVDNGYSDALAAAVRPYLADSRITLIRQENRGSWGGRAAAAAVAHGRYFVVLNSDDLVTPRFCERMADVLGRHPDTAAITCDALLRLEPGGRYRRRSYLQDAGLKRTPDEAMPLRLADVVDGPCPYYCAPIRRDVWQALGGWASETPLVEDLDFWLRSIAAGYPVRMIPDRLAVFRILPGSISRPATPAAAELFEEQRERALTRAVASSGTAEDAAALARVQRRLRYQQAVRRARVALRAGDAPTAATQYRIARRQRRTVRATVLATVLRWFPGTALRAHAAKQRLHPVREQVAQRIRRGPAT